MSMAALRRTAGLGMATPIFPIEQPMPSHHTSPIRLTTMRQMGDWTMATLAGERALAPLPRTGRGALCVLEGEGPPWRAVPLDAVVLSLCLLGALVRPPDPSATLIAVAATVLLGVYWAVAFFRRPGEDAGRAFRVQLAIVLALIGLLVVMPTLAAIGDRHDTAPYRDVHDSALQIELATGMLLHGQDYYRATYFHTPLAQWWPVGPPNPALYHTDSLPFQEELTVPFMLAGNATTLFLMYYFGRFFHASFIAFTLSLVLLAFCLDTRVRTHLSLDFLLLF